MKSLAATSTLNSVTLYSSVGCHLCEQARAMLQHVIAKHQLNADIDEIDVLINDDIEARYATKIPVVVVNNTELGYPFDLPLLEDWLLNAMGEAVNG